jgi:hypothetical protein
MPYSEIFNQYNDLTRICTEWAVEKWVNDIIKMYMENQHMLNDFSWNDDVIKIRPLFRVLEVNLIF